MLGTRLVRRSESPLSGVLLVSFVAVFLGWNLMEYGETPVAFVEGKCGETDIEKKGGRSGEGAILYS